MLVVWNHRMYILTVIAVAPVVFTARTTASVILAATAAFVALFN